MSPARRGLIYKNIEQGQVDSALKKALEARRTKQHRVGQYTLFLYFKPKPWHERMFDQVTGKDPQKQNTAVILQQAEILAKTGQLDPEIHQLLKNRLASLPTPQTPIKNVHFVKEDRVESVRSRLDPTGQLLRLDADTQNQTVKYSPDESFGQQAPAPGIPLPSVRVSYRGLRGLSRLGRNLFSGFGIQAKKASLATLRGLGSLGLRGVGIGARILAGIAGGAGVGISGATLGFIIAGVIGVIIFFGFIIGGYQSVFIEEKGGPGIPGGSQFIGITNTANPPGPFANEQELPDTISYNLTVSSLKEALINTQVKSTVYIHKLDGSRETLQERSWAIENITDNWQPPVDDKSLTLEVGDKSRFKDSFLVNIIEVTAQISGQERIESNTHSTSIIIGNPPSDCPSGWPTDWGDITQGPQVIGNSHQGYEAIDVGSNVKSGRRSRPLSGETIKSTSAGVAMAIQSSFGYGNHVKVTTVCRGTQIIMIYAHLSDFSRIFNFAGTVSNSVSIQIGTPLGFVGSTGYSTGPHLHYEVQGGLKINELIPETIPACSDYLGYGGNCTVYWPRP